MKNTVIFWCVFSGSPDNTCQQSRQCLTTIATVSHNNRDGTSQPLRLFNAINVQRITVIIRSSIFCRITRRNGVAGTEQRWDCLRVSIASKSDINGRQMGEDSTNASSFSSIDMVVAIKSIKTCLSLCPLTDETHPPVVFCLFLQEPSFVTLLRAISR